MASVDKFDNNFKISFKIILTLTLIHAIGDFFSSFTKPLLPLFAKNLSLSLTQIGFLTAFTGILSFVIQPSTGYIADRYKTRIFLIGAPLLTIIFIPLTGIAPSFFILICFIGLGAMGSAMYHPATAGAVGKAAGKNISFAMSFYITGGTLAFGLGPIFISYYVTYLKLSLMPLCMILGLVVMLLILKYIPHPEPQNTAGLNFWDSLKDSFGSVWKLIALLWIIMVFRSFIGQSLSTYLPFYYDHLGYSQIALGYIIALIEVGGAISGLFCGYLAGRSKSYKPLFYITHLISVPVLLLQLHVSGLWIYCNAFFSGFFIMATMPLGVAWAQQMAPKGRAMVSSLMMGLAWGVGSLLVPLTGKLGEMFDLKKALAIVAFIPLLTLILIYYLPNEKVSENHVGS